MYEMGLGLYQPNRVWWSSYLSELSIDFKNNRYVIDGSTISFSDLFTFTRASKSWAMTSDNKLREYASGVARLTDKGYHHNAARDNRNSRGPVNPKQWIADSSQGTFEDEGDDPAIVPDVTLGDVTFNRTKFTASVNVWNRADFANIFMNAGDSVSMVFYVIAGSSGNMRLTTKRGTGGGQSTAQDAGMNGSFVFGAATGDWEYSSHRTFTVGSDTIHEYKFVWTADNTDNHGFQIGPDGIVGDDIILLGGCAFIANSPSDFIAEAISVAADDLTFNDETWFNGLNNPGTFFVESTYFKRTDDLTAQYVLSARADDNNNIGIVNSTSTGNRINASVVAGGVEQGPVDDATLTYTQGTVFRAVVSCDTNDLALTVDGDASVEDTSVTLPTGSADIHIGSFSGSTLFADGITCGVGYASTDLSNPIIEALATNGNIPLSYV